MRRARLLPSEFEFFTRFRTKAGYDVRPTVAPRGQVFFFFFAGEQIFLAFSVLCPAFF